MSGTEAVVSDEERRKKYVYYEACTSPFKDDLQTLVKCLKSPEPGNPHSRQEAGFLLWHHALEGDDPAGLLAAGLPAACVANLDSGEVLPADRACSAGLLLALASDDEEAAELLLRTRCPSGRTALDVLHAVLQNDEALARQYCARLLLALVQQDAAAVVRAMEHQLPYLSTYLTLWRVRSQRDASAMAAVAEAVAGLLEAAPELAAAVVAADGVAGLLEVVRNQKSEAAVTAAAQCLARLLAAEAPTAVEKLVAAGGVPLLVDVLGPPPRVALENRPETVAEEEVQAATPGTPPPPSLAAAAAAAAAATRRLSEQSDDGGTGVGEEDAAADGGSDHADEGGGDRDGAAAVAGGDGGDNSDGNDDDHGNGHGIDSGGGAGTDTALEADLERERSVRFSAEPSSAPAVSPGSRSAAALSPVGSPTSQKAKAGVGAWRAAAKGLPAGGGGGSGWSSSRSSHRLLGGPGGTSVTARVQLPLVIPGLHSPSAAAAAAALLGSPLPSSRALRVSSGVLGTIPSSPSVTLDGGVDTAAAAAAAVLAMVDGSSTAASARPPLPTAADLSTNRCGLHWILLPGLEVASRAAECLTRVVMKLPETQVEAELRLASHRLVAHVRAVMGAKAGSAASDKKAGGSKKKKGLGLSAEQSAALTRVAGLLKFLSMHNTTRYRIAQLGAVPWLVRLYSEGTDYLLRNHCQAILANVALLAENGAALREAALPEEFLVANPMRLTSYERAVLRIEFPEDPALQPRRC